MLRAVVAGGAGVIVALLGGAAVASGALGESLATALVLLLLLAVPITKDLPSRLATGIALIFGLAPLTWWVAWPFQVNHAAVLTALISGGLCAYLLGADDPRARLSRVVPTVSSTDWLLVGGALAATVATLPLTAAKTSIRSLIVLVPGADNWAHYAMFANLRTYGAVPQVLGPSPDGSTWAFSGYPKSFHALVATLSEIGYPRLETGPDSLVAYTHAVGLTVVLGTLMVTAAIVRLPGVRGRLGVALPVVVLTWTALLWEPGQKVLANGFASFWVGAVASGCALLLGLESRRQPVWTHLIAVGGLLLCVAQTWTPLIILAAPAMLLVLVPETGQKLSTAARWLPRGVVLIASAAAVVKAILVLASSVSIGFLVGEVSGFDGTSPLPTFALFAALVLVLTRARTRDGRRPDVALTSEIARPRRVILLLTPVLGFLSLTVFLALQIHVLGTTSYYFLKYLIGFELVLACITPAICAMYVPAALLANWSLSRSAMAGAIVAAMATQLFAPVTQRYTLLFSDTDDGTAAINAPYRREGIATGVLLAVASVEPSESLRTEYLPIGDGNAIETFYPDAWYHAINSTVTSHVMERMNVLRVRADRPDKAASLAQRLLATESDLRIVVRAPLDDQVRSRLGDPAIAERLLALQ